MAYDSPSGLIAMSVIIELLAITMVTLRFISRRRMRAGFRTDDWLICAALMLGTGLCIVEIYGVVVEAFGLPISKGSRPTLERYYEGLRLQWAFLLLNTIAITLIKLSAVFLYRRLFTTKGIFGTISLGYIIFLTAWGVTFTMWLIFQCGSHVTAIYTNYDAWVKYCSKTNSAGYALVYTDLLTDLVTLIMPLPIVAKLHTSLGCKLAIAGVFAIGAFTVAASTTRAAIYTHSQQTNGDDIFLMITSLSVWAYLEVMVGICAACAITIRPVFADISMEVYSSRLSSLRESVHSVIFSGRSSITKASSSGSAETLAVSQRNEKDMEIGVDARSLDLESSRSSEHTQERK